MKILELKNLTQNRYTAIEETRNMLGFTPSEWRYLLRALSKTDNGWFQFMRGNLTIDFKKFVDINELHMQITFEKGKTKKSTNYTYDLNEFTKPKAKKIRVSQSKK